MCLERHNANFYEEIFLPESALFNKDVLASVIFCKMTHGGKAFKCGNKSSNSGHLLREINAGAGPDI